MAKILVVDDDFQTRHLYASLLSPFGHQVVQAGDGVDGLKLAEKDEPDLIISDILMPTMNGYEFVSSLRQLPSLQKVPLIFQSASFLDHQSRVLGMACGVREFLAKPSEPERILETVNRVLGLPATLPSPLPALPAKDPIPVLIDAFYEKGKQLDTVSMRLAALLELGLQMSQSNVPQELLEKTASAARKIIGASYAGAGTLEGDGSALRFFVTSGMDAATAQKLSKPAVAGTFRQIAIERRAIRVFSHVGEPAALQLPAYHPPVRGFLGVPIQTGTRAYGLIYVADKLEDIEFTHEDEHFLATIGAKVAVAYENILRYQDIQEQTQKLHREIEQRKQAEERFRLLIETAPTGILICDGEGRISEANAQIQQMFGYNRGELIGQPVEVLVPVQHRSAHLGHRTKYVTDPEARPMGLGMELFGCRKDGTTFPIEISLGPLTTHEGILISSTVVDISERKKLERQLQVSQRLEAVGQLAAGIAHDFNNILTAITGNTRLALADLPCGHPLQANLEEIDKASSRATKLVRQILSFSRQGESNRQLINLRDVVEEALKLLRSGLPSAIEIRTHFQSDLPKISADSTQIHQIIMNLGTNAAHAIGDRDGFIEVELNASDECLELSPSQYVRLSFRDNGGGMESIIADHIFEPFFTTKPPGQGTGLGLPVVHGIVEKHDGKIKFSSEVGKGTVFHLWFPVADKTSLQRPTQPSALPTDVRGNGQHILYVDDDEPLVFLMTRMLERVGFQVTGCTDPLRALEIFRAAPEEFDALVTDLSMPGMSGTDLARTVWQIRPEMPALIASGYIRPEDNERVRELGMHDIILKPDTIEDLGKLLHQLLSVQHGEWRGHKRARAMGGADHETRCLSSTETKATHA